MSLVELRDVVFFVYSGDDRPICNNTKVLEFFNKSLLNVLILISLSLFIDNFLKSFLNLSFGYKKIKV